MADSGYHLDYARWPTRREVASVEAAVDEAIAADGLVSVCGQHPPIDVLVSGLATAPDHTGAPILVGLSGAVAGRSGKPGPFLSGAGIARDTGLPLVALSDPTLALDPDVPLGWYAGNHTMRDLPTKLAEMLASLATRTRRRLLLFGGSGGGFAAMQLAALIGERATALAWNPQTAIADYVPASVAHYLRVAFPTTADEATQALALPAAAAHARLRWLLDRECPHHDLRGGHAGEHRVLYMQNLGDWHVGKHAGPYLQALRPVAGDGSALASEDGRQVMWLGAWGDGHATPSRDMILTALLALAERADPAFAAERLERQAVRQGDIASTARSLRYGSRTHSLNLSLHADNGRVEARASLDAMPGRPTAQVDYAFYLLRDGKRGDARWYRPENTAVFQIPSTGGRLQVQAFARDMFHDVLVSPPVDLPV